MATWHEVVHTAVRNLVEDTGESEFTRQELLDHSWEAFRAKSKGETPEQNVSQTLQRLRNLGEIEFVERGRYRILVGADDPLRQGKKPERPTPRQATYTSVKTYTRNFQDWLRSHVVPNFDHRCGVCGLGPEWFLDAAHLRPVRQHPHLAGDAGAAVALCGNHHRALDAGALTIERDLHLTVRAPDEMEGNEELTRILLSYEGARLRAPHWDLTPEALPSLPARPRSDA